MKKITEGKSLYARECGFARAQLATLHVHVYDLVLAMAGTSLFPKTEGPLQKLDSLLTCTLW